MQISILKTLIVLILELPLLLASIFLVGFAATDIIKADMFSHISLFVLLFGIFGCVISVNSIRATRQRTLSQKR